MLYVLVVVTWLCAGSRTRFRFSIKDLGAEMLRLSLIVEFICYRNINSVANTRLRFQEANT